MNISKREIRILIGVGVILIFLPIIFTQNLGLISFQDTGEIGDTIGGITAPFIGFFGAVLLYLTLRAQIKANKQTKKQFKKQAKKESLERLTGTYEDRIQTLALEIKSFQFSVDINENKSNLQPEFQTFSGSQAIYQLLKRKSKIYTPQWKSAYILEPKFEELRQLLLLFLEVTESLKKQDFTKNQNENDRLKSYFESKLKYYFISKLKGNIIPLKEFKAPDQENPDCCSSTHGFPEDLHALTETISQHLE